MTNHQLTNARTIRQPLTVPPGTGQPLCHHCRTPLAEVPPAGIITRAHKHTYCSEDCYDRYVRDVLAPAAVARHVASPQYQAKERARQTRHVAAEPERQPSAAHLEAVKVAAFHRRQAGKSNTRKTTEVAANVVGFAIWLIVISVIAIVLLAVL